MAKSKRPIGKTYEITADDLASHSIEELIDRGIRFDIAYEDDEEPEEPEEEGEECVY